MSGNVWEWCQDWWAEDYYSKCTTDGTVKNPSSAEKGSRRVYRSGGWDHYPQRCRTAFRHYWQPDYRFSFIGFRLCLAASEVDVNDASREHRSQETT